MPPKRRPQKHNKAVIWRHHKTTPVALFLLGSCVFAALVLHYLAPEAPFEAYFDVSTPPYSSQLGAKERSFRALVIGGTGALGKVVVKRLLDSDACVGVTMLSRRRVDDFIGTRGEHKLRQTVVSFENITAAVLGIDLPHSVCISMIGVSNTLDISYTEVHEAEVALPVAFAVGCRQSASVRQMSVMSVAGASAHSDVSHLALKGEADARIKQLDFNRLSLFRPSVIITEESRFGLANTMWQILFPYFHGCMPSKFRSVPAALLAEAMVRDLERFDFLRPSPTLAPLPQPHSTAVVFDYDQIHAICAL